MKFWKEENPIAYRKMQISNEIRKLNHEITKIEYGLLQGCIDYYKQKISKLKQEYANLR